jgi:hypothetical protein
MDWMDWGGGNEQAGLGLAPYTLTYAANKAKEPENELLIT